MPYRTTRYVETVNLTTQYMSDLQAMARGAMLMANLNPPSRVIYPPGAVLDDSLFVSSGQMSSGYLFTTSDLTELLAKGAIVPV